MRRFHGHAKLQELDVTGELQGVIDLITDPKSFYAQFLEGALENVRYDTHFRKKISRNLMHHLKALKDYNVLEEVDQEPTVVLHGFTVEKKSGGRRFVLDGRKLRCNAVDAKMTLDEKGYGVPTQLFETFGVSFDLRHHIYRSDPEWIKKFLANSAHAKVTGGMATPREIYKVVGGMVWHSYVTNSFLCFLPATLSFMRDIARDLYNTAAWDTPTAVRPSVVKEVKERTIRIKENPWIERGPTSSITAWSDASSKAWAAILESEPQQVSQADFSNEQEHWHIYRKELYAAKQAVALAARSVHTTRLRLMVDNLPAVHSLQRGHSSDYRSNFVIAELFTLAAGARIQVACEWVPTLEQKADKYTRGVVADYPITLPV